MKIGLALLCGLGLAPTSAPAADWTPIRIAGSADQYFLDRSKLVISGNEVTYWKKVVFKKPQRIKDQSVASGLMREQIDCIQHTLRLMSYLYHNAQGAVIEYVSEPAKDASPIIPDTVGDVFEHEVCALRAAPVEGRNAL